MQAPPSSAAELRKLAIVSTWTSNAPPAATVDRLSDEGDDAGARRPTATIAGRIDASVRPTVAQ